MSKRKPPKGKRTSATVAEQTIANIKEQRRTQAVRRAEDLSFDGESSLNEDDLSERDALWNNLAATRAMSDARLEVVMGVVEKYGALSKPGDRYKVNLCGAALSLEHARLDTLIKMGEENAEFRDGPLEQLRQQAPQKDGERAIGAVLAMVWKPVDGTDAVDPVFEKLADWMEVD